RRDPIPRSGHRRAGSRPRRPAPAGRRSDPSPAPRSLAARGASPAPRRRAPVPGAPAAGRGSGRSSPSTLRDQLRLLPAGIGELALLRLLGAGQEGGAGLGV